MSDSPKPGNMPIDGDQMPADFQGGQMPADFQGGQMPADFQGGSGPVPEGADSAQPYPGGMMQIDRPKVKGWPYVRRALKMLGNHKGIVTATMLLTLAMNLAPFVVAAAFGPIVAILGKAAEGNTIGNVWSVT